jgi:hypothetical protein
MELHPRRVCLSDASLQDYCSSLLDLRSLSIGAKLPAATHITDRGVQRVCAVLTQLTQLTLQHILVGGVCPPACLLLWCRLYVALCPLGQLPM